MRLAKSSSRWALAPRRSPRRSSRSSARFLEAGPSPAATLEFERRLQGVVRELCRRVAEMTYNAIEPADPSYKIPHMGWNELVLQRSHPVFDGVVECSHTYFVHSFHFAVGDAADLIATADYAQPLTAAVGRDNMVGTQFHPEKSQAAGLRLIANFLRLRP